MTTDVENRRGEDRVSLGTVLVVDDSNAIRRILCRTLQSAGYRVVEACDGEQALEACRAEQPDLVLLDYDMPVMDGPTALRAMKADTSLRAVPVLFLTARTGGTDVAAGLELGAQDYVRKPCEPAELTARVASALRIKAQEQALARQAAELDALSTTDSLTGLGNRRRLEARVRELIEIHGANTLFSALIIDVDHFKLVNDTHGHAVGDTVLKIVAGRMSGAIEGHAIGRWGGEEFLAVVVGHSDDDTVAFAERVRTAVGCDPIAIGEDRRITVTVSIGCSSGPLECFEAVVSAADTGLYDAKRAGRNRVVGMKL